MSNTAGVLTAGEALRREDNFVKWQAVGLFLASVAVLYFELLVIRYLATEIRVFAYLKNIPLIASFLGIDTGMLLGRRRRLLQPVV